MVGTFYGQDATYGKRCGRSDTNWYYGPGSDIIDGGVPEHGVQQPVSRACSR